MSASLADQPQTPPATLAIALGANLGDPLATLLAVRPRLEQLLQAGAPVGAARLRWSPLFRTEPVGGPPGQPPYLNAVVLADRLARAAAAGAAANLLQQLLGLEAQFGRERRERWGPRHLDLDLLWWGDLQLDTAALQLPHPRLQQRSFVLAPLAWLDPQLRPPGQSLACGSALAALQPRLAEAPPQPLPGQPGWPE